jgi:hypothetical protein
MPTISRPQAEALIACHRDDARVICQCLDCIWAREVLAQWDALEEARRLEGVA